MNVHKKLAKCLKKAHKAASRPGFVTRNALLAIEQIAMEACASAADYPGCNKWYKWLSEDEGFQTRQQSAIEYPEPEQGATEAVEYRLLEKGEIIQAGDECEDIDTPTSTSSGWRPVEFCVGLPVDEKGGFRRRIENPVTPSCGCDKRCDDSCGCACHAEVKTERLPSVLYKGMFSGKRSFAVQVTQELLDNRDQWPEWMDTAARKPWGEEENALRLYEDWTGPGHPFVLQIYAGPDADSHPRVALDEWLLQSEDSGRLSALSNMGKMLPVGNTKSD